VKSWSETDGAAKTAEQQKIFRSTTSAREASWATTPKTISSPCAQPVTAPDMPPLKQATNVDLRGAHSCDRSFIANNQNVPVPRSHFALDSKD
jgi:hypothetical protein